MIENIEFGHVDETIVSVKLVDGKMEVVKRRPSRQMLLTNPPQPAPDIIVKEIYAAVEGEVRLIDKINGKHTPGRYVQEEISFE